MLRRLVAAGCVIVLALPAEARADLTAFLGTTPTPVNRPVRGIALGVSLLIVGFEIEYANTAEDRSEAAPSLRTGMFNLLGQTPIPIGGVQFYATAGFGLYREQLAAVQRTHLGANVGGGAKIALAGPLGLRLDYRVFTLRGPARFGKPQRVYAGVNLRF